VNTSTIGLWIARIKYKYECEYIDIDVSVDAHMMALSHSAESEKRWKNIIRMDDRSNVILLNRVSGPNALAEPMRITDPPK
jgi:hypothetical protein